MHPFSLREFSRSPTPADLDVLLTFGGFPEPLFAQRKLYLWDWSGVEEGGPRFENLVASQLLKYCHWVEDTEGHAMELRYLRDTDGREVDFVVLRNRKPLFAVECKSGEKAVSPVLHYVAERTPIPRFYQIRRGTRSFATGLITVLPFIRWCEELDLP